MSDRDDDVFIGLKLPLILDNGFDSSTQTTIEAVKYNLRNLISTELGERVMQPNLGIRLKKFLFDPFTSDVVESIKSSIFDTLAYWLPFVQVENIIVEMSEANPVQNQGGEYNSRMEVSIEFSLKKDPTTTDSVQINIGD